MFARDKVAVCDSNNSGAHGANDYTCSCAGGGRWSGRTCNVDEGECASNPCSSWNAAAKKRMASGTCSDFLALRKMGVNSFGYRCTCAAGYTGALCDKDVDECASSPCQNGAACSDSITNSTIKADSFRCACKPGSNGTLCESDQDECASSPCVNSANCSESSMSGSAVTLGAFGCSCVKGWAGDRCQTDIDECSSSPCQNGGACSDSKTNASIAVNAHRCVCKNGFSGPTCAVDNNECATSPCKNNATCSESNGNATVSANDFVCACKPGWQGKECSVVIGCFANGGKGSCKNGGKCSDNLQGGGKAIKAGDYSCACGAGWEGADCGKDIDECKSCLTMGTASCEESGTADSTFAIGAFQCRCNKGWSGATCSVDIDECSSSPCLRNATCSASVSTGQKANTFYCACPFATYSGSRCELETRNCDAKDKNDCSSNATCTHTGAGTHSCACK